MDKSLAIAYAVKRKNQKAKGGMVGCYANGGMVEEDQPMSMIDSIMKKRKMMMAEGGMIENDNGHDDFDMDSANNLEMVDGLSDNNDFLSSAPQMPTDEMEDEQKMKRSKMLGGILARVRYGK